MKMGRFEKRFVNAAAHSRHVAVHAVRRLRHVPLQVGWRYLDVGCGNGTATLHVADTFGVRAVGVDLDPAQIELARRAAGTRSDVSFLTASATHLPFATDAFDIVSTNKTMHHVAEWRLALDELTRVAARGGYVVFADLIVPLVLARLLRPTVIAGVFTRCDLDHSFSGLRDVHRSAGWLHYEAVLVKP
jgi:ubiquinone/menaquinone biosynthesis C-methylase UbiE